MANPTGKGGFQERPETRNHKGQRNKAAVSFARSLRDYIIKEGKIVLKYTDDSGKLHKVSKIETVVRALYKEAMGGNMVAVNFIADRVEGKVADELKHSGTIHYELEYVNDWRDEANQIADAAYRAKDDLAEQGALQVGERGETLAQNDDGVTSGN